MGQQRQRMPTGAYLTRLERVQGGGYHLAWQAATREEWHIVLDRMRHLPPDLRRYLDEDDAWWIDSSLLMQVGPWFGNFAQIIDSHPEQSRIVLSKLHVPVEVALAFNVLHLTPDASPELIKAAQRVHAKQHHPDLGGHHNEMISINLAVERALAWAENNGRR